MLSSLSVALTPGLIGDIVVVVVLLVFAIIAAARGFFKCLMGFVGTVLSIVLAVLFSKALAHTLQNWFGLLDKLTAAFESAFSKTAAFAAPIGENAELSILGSSLPSFLGKLILKLVPAELISPDATIAGLISPIVANIVLLIISFLIIFILIKLLTLILNKTLGEAIRSIPVVRSVNSLFGFVLGALEGLFFVYLILLVFGVFQFEFFTNFILQTTVLQFFYQNNVLGSIISWVLSTDWLAEALSKFQLTIVK